MAQPMDSKELLKELDNIELITSWTDVARLIEFFSAHNGIDWLFRGVSSSEHKPLPKIFRDIRKQKALGRLPYSLADERAIFAQFRDMATPHIQWRPQTEIEWLALAQHHGLPTRMLDWTESLLVAIWFAVRAYEPLAELDHGTGKVSIKHPVPTVWVLWNIGRVDDAEKVDPFGIGIPKSYRPPHISPRITAQQSVLTIQSFDHRIDVDANKWLVHLQIDPKSFFHLKKRIDACGVNERTMFPGLDGLASDLGWRYKNNYLAGYL